MKTKTQSKKVNKAWLNDHVNDPYVKQAKVDGFRARAAYKLKEIDETFKLIKPGHVVVDLGSTPGAWSQYVRRRLSPTGAAVGALNGTIIALDILPMEPIEGVEFILGDFTEQATLDALLSKVELLVLQNKGPEADFAPKNDASPATKPRVVDVVVSDIAPNLSGIADTDAARIELLIELAVDFAQNQLKPEGALVVKLFHGGAYEPLVKLFRQTFKVVKSLKPKSSRDKSSETFLVGMGLKSLVAKEA
jgi:23S rRNA (uridine2552-2'-O)-methyltransferase